MHVIHRLAELSTPRKVVEGWSTGTLSLLQCREGGAGNPDRTHICTPHRTPGRHITGLPTETRAGPALVANDEREAIAHRAPYLHVGDEIADTVKRKINRWYALAQWTPPLKMPVEAFGECLRIEISTGNRITNRGLEINWNGINTLWQICGFSWCHLDVSTGSCALPATCNCACYSAGCIDDDAFSHNATLRAVPSGRPPTARPY